MAISIYNPLTIRWNAKPILLGSIIYEQISTVSSCLTVIEGYKFGNEQPLIME